MDIQSLERFNRIIVRARLNKHVLKGLLAVGGGLGALRLAYW